jgi:hypothetical protein
MRWLHVRILSFLKLFCFQPIPCVHHNWRRGVLSVPPWRESCAEPIKDCPTSIDNRPILVGANPRESVRIDANEGEAPLLEHPGPCWHCDTPKFTFLAPADIGTGTCSCPICVHLGGTALSTVLTKGYVNHILPRDRLLKLLGFKDYLIS